MARKHNKRYVCDFETSTEEWLKYDDRVRVWAWSLVDIDDVSKIQYGNCIESLFYWFENLNENVMLYYHNLKFDGQYLIWELNHRNFTWVDYDPSKKKKYPANSYSTVITDVNQWYQIILFYKDHTITIRDSMKLYDMSVDTIAKSLGFEEQKLTLDYERYRPVGYVLQPYEVEYITHDVVIVAKALKTLFDAGHTKMTISSDALSDFKRRCKDFKTLFPELPEETDAFVRQSYKGGFTYANPVHTDKHYKKRGVVFDYNSLYPSILYDELMPYGEPVWFDGEYKKDPEYPLYVQMLTCYFNLKDGKIPSLQLKHNPRFLPNEYIKSSKNDAYTITLTSVDLELFKEQYDIEVVEYKGGFKFKGQHNMYKEYIDSWTEEKIKAKKEGNKTMYLISKKFLNSLYGKTGANPHGGMKRPVLNEHDLISYPAIEDNSRKSIYVPTATFCTSYGRKRIIEACQFIRDWSLEHKGYDAWTYS